MMAEENMGVNLPIKKLSLEMWKGFVGLILRLITLWEELYMRCKSRAWSQMSLYSHTLLILSSSDKGFLFFPQACKKRVGTNIQGSCFLQQPQLTPQSSLPPEFQLLRSQKGGTASEWKGGREKEGMREEKKNQKH